MNWDQVSLSQSIVQVAALGCLLYPNSFKHSSLQVVLQYFRSIPIWPVVVVPSMNCNSILPVICLHCILVFSDLFPQGPPGFSDVHYFTVSTWDSVDNLLLLHLWCGCLHVHQQLSQCSLSLEDGPYTNLSAGGLYLLRQALYIGYEEARWSSGGVIPCLWCGNILCFRCRSLLSFLERL